MKNVFTANAAIKAAEIIATGEMIGEIVDEVTERSSKVVDMLEAMDKSISEKTND